VRAWIRFTSLPVYLLPLGVISLLLSGIAVTGTRAVAQLSAQVQSQWTQPTAEELSMTSQPQVPGAAAVYLYREETTDDTLHMRSMYVRLKVLTEKGKEYGSVRLNYLSDVAAEDSYSSDFGFTVTDISGRTIHSDGTVIPFNGKPYKRVVEKSQGVKVTETVFSLPDVEVGSILEYRYKFRVPDGYFVSPNWYVQQDLFVRKGYYFWKATEDELFDELRNEYTVGISWSAVLPAGTQVVHIEKPSASSTDKPYQTFELKVKDIAPMPVEDHMPPVRSFTYRVNFYYAVDRSGAEFWKNEGKAWAKSQEKFIGSTGSMAQQVQTLIAPGDSDPVKLQKIYAAVQAMDNTSYSRRRDAAENKAAGLKEIKTAQDVWDRKSGYDDQLANLFIALARSAGFKAYAMRVTSRDRNLFFSTWLTLHQLDDNIAVVVVDGKEQFYDPGQRYCPLGQLAWKHTGVQGLREVDGGTAIGNTPLPSYMLSQVQRIGDLLLATDGTVTGTLKVTWLGSPALHWRQESLLRDEKAMRNSMKERLQEMLPAGLELAVTDVLNVTDYEKPLVANFSVHGPLATVTAKRLILPGQLFEVNSKPLFPHPTRTIPIYFNYGERTIDAVRIKFPSDLKIESVPKEDSFSIKAGAAYHDKPDAQATYLLIRRTYDLGAPYFLPAEYGEVRDFYNKISVDDQQPIVFTNAAVSTNQSVAEPNAKAN
jgi:transglutaminase-like putative cysteine protease